MARSFLDWHAAIDWHAPSLIGTLGSNLLLEVVLALALSEEAEVVEIFWGEID